jgi:hypothetical protein
MQVKAAHLFLDVCGANISGGWSLSVEQVPEIQHLLTDESYEGSLLVKWPIGYSSLCGKKWSLNFSVFLRRSKILLVLMLCWLTDYLATLYQAHDHVSLLLSFYVIRKSMHRYPLSRRLGGPPGRSGRVRNISSPPGFDSRTVQPVASHYTADLSRPTQRTKTARK